MRTAWAGAAASRSTTRWRPSPPGQRVTVLLNPIPTDGFTGRAAAASVTHRFCAPSYPTAADLATAPLRPGRPVAGYGRR